MTARSLHTFALLVCATALTVGCSGGSDSGSPVGPSPAGPGAGPAGATISGTVSGGGAAQARALGTGLGGVKVSVDGTDLSATTNGNGAFTINGVPPGLVRLLFQGGGASGMVDLNEVSQSETIAIAVVVNGASVELESEARTTGSEAQLEGKIASINYPGRSMVVGTTTVTVPDGVEITNGYRLLAFTDLIVGTRIHVKGTRTGETVTASRILAQQTGLENVTLNGTASDVAGTCPDRTFKFGSTQFAVNRSTIFVQGSCEQIQNGLTLEVRGLRRPDGSVLATQVKFNKKDDEDDEDGVPVEFSGTISGLSGPCPARRFMAGSRDVQTNGATNFLTPCATLANGQTVAIKGKQTGGGKVIAKEVK